MSTDDDLIDCGRRSKTIFILLLLVEVGVETRKGDPQGGAHMSRIPEDAYWLDLMSLFKVTYWSCGDFFKAIFIWENYFFH